MINFDDYYFLLHAYDVLGRHLYGDGWDGTEYKQDSVPSPSEVDEKRKPHIESIQLIEPRLNEIAKAISKEVRAEAIHKLKTEEADLLARRGQHQSTFTNTGNQERAISTGMTATYEDKQRKNIYLLA
ncbi:hypothetical protein GH722_19390 [Alphaproteobacteria bacterium HT1-32]|nr:hypothetical protein [Alphaproteobacteria bacterium HT1-32]